MIAEAHEVIIAALAHEIKNPVALAMAHIELARLVPDNADAIRAHLTHIQQALADINDLVHEMLFASYGDAPFHDINIHELLEEMLEAYRVAWPGISFVMDLTEPIIFHGQEQFLRMIVSNLLKNSVEAVNNATYPGHVIVIAEMEGGRLHLSVCDNGLSNGNKPNSNGLGLAICHKLTARMNGMIEISVGESGGCVADVWLPSQICTAAI